MKKLGLSILFLLILFAPEARSENVGSLISPGELSQSHAKWEGIKNCTKCHVLGGGVPDDKCLTCHDKITDQIKQLKGLHSKFKDPCVKCHSEHKGRAYKLFSLDEKNFDHGQTGYPLIDKHAAVECGKCHTKKDTYKGLSRECLSCHKDYHDNQLGKDCARCHSFKSWKDLAKFDHTTASKYILTGKHVATKCEKCHANNRYRIPQFDRCTTCHKDPHRGGKPNCTECHTTDGWKKVKIDHDKTKYPLTNKHREVGCDKCHVQNRLTGIPFATCNGSNCHQDVHKGQFKKQACESCHTTAGFKPSLFKHNAPEYTGFKLDGKHVDTPCQKCHVEGKFKPIASKTCDGSGCHADVHKDQFKNQTCESCHNTAGFKPSLFKHNAPDYKGFKLDGKHIDTPCQKCHVEGKFKPLPQDCASCHIKDDIHKKELGNNCSKCHITEDWKKVLFDHNKQSKFPLIGKHKDTECEKCHENKKYKINKEKCSDCHEDYHKGEFKGTCDSCHTPFSWEPRKFNHEKEAGLKLQGLHNDLVCSDCHLQKGIYKGARRLCMECHIDPHFNQFGVSNCAQCHNQNSWNPLQFNHSRTGFPLIGNHRNAECQDCHQNRMYRNVPNACISCHSSDYQGALNHVAQGYSQDCRGCHYTTFTTWDFNHAKISSSAHCAVCHLNQQPADHVTRNFGTACENCHKYPTWDFNHNNPITASNCALCHINNRPQSHVTNNYTTVCETCHKYPTWDFNHATASAGKACSVCHLNNQPADHVTKNFGTACENCHAYPTWAFNHALVSASTACVICHSADAPASHATNNYGTACQTCHQYPTWTFVHPAGKVACALCHLSTAPSAHTLYPTRFGTACENCHTYPSWTPATFNHSFSAFPIPHRGYSRCSDCHPGENYGNSGGCIECHTATGAKVHNTTLNSECLVCHWNGKVNKPRLNLRPRGK